MKQKVSILRNRLTLAAATSALVRRFLLGFGTITEVTVDVLGRAGVCWGGFQGESRCIHSHLDFV
jgi:hypothetical protein